MGNHSELGSLVGMRPRLERLWTAAVCVYAACLAWRPLEEADTFFHLSLGRAVLASHARIVPEPTAFKDFTDPAVASEWLWSVFTYAAYRLGGFELLSALAALLAATAAYATWRLVRAHCSDAIPWSQQQLFFVLVLCVIQSRVVMRPQLLMLSVLPGYLLATRAYARLELSRRVRLAGLLVLGVVVWAQFHGSFVLAPVIFVIQVSRKWSDGSRAELRLDAGVFALLLGAMLTTAYGVNVVGFITSHAAGDAPSFIAEMSSPSWASLRPTASPSNCAFWCVCLFCLAGMAVARRWFARESALTLLGIALLSTANRFIAEAALLATPLLGCSGAALAEHLERGMAAVRVRVLRGSWLVVSVGLLVWTARFTQQQRGPLLRAGLLTAAAPVYAHRVLAGLPTGSAVFTDYTSSASLGFFSEGRLRTFVDGRTPLYFDDTAFGVQRDMLRDPAALRRGLQRYRARAAVVRRDSEACAQLAEFMSVAMVEPLFSTFVLGPASDGPAALRACGVSYLAADGCADPRLGTSIAFVRRYGAREFARYLDAHRAVHCQGDVARASSELDQLSATARPYWTAFRRTQVEALMRTGRYDAATALMIDALSTDDPAVINLLQSPSAGQLPLGLVREILESYVARARDDADPAIRAMLAEVCLRVQDVPCMRFHAIRAAVRGRRTQALDWLAQHDESPRIRHDAQRWRDILVSKQ